MAEFVILHDIRTTNASYRAGDVVGDQIFDLTDLENAGGAYLAYLPAMQPVIDRFNSLRLSDATTETAVLFDLLALSGFVGGGESNTSSNEGGGEGLALPKSGANLPFKTLKAGTNVTLTPGADEIEISSTGGAGEANTTSTVGTGASLTLTKVGVDLPFKSIAGGQNILVANGAEELTISAIIPTSLANGGFQNFSLGMANQDGPIWSGGAGTLGDLWGHVTMCPESFDVVNMVCWITQLSGAGKVRMGIYDVMGQLLGETNPLTIFSLGVNILTMKSPVSVIGGNGYYLALWTNVNGMQFLRVGGRWTGAGPAIAFEFPNADVSGGGLPSDVSSNLGNKQSQRYYCAAIRP